VRLLRKCFKKARKKRAETLILNAFFVDMQMIAGTEQEWVQVSGDCGRFPLYTGSFARSVFEPQSTTPTLSAGRGL
jgi:hypothetical protein